MSKDEQRDLHAVNHHAKQQAAQFLALQTPTEHSLKEPKRSIGLAITARDRHRALEQRNLIKQQRIHINRLKMHKRHHKRFGKDIVPRLVTTFTIVIGIVLIIMSGTGGAAYAYYQSQLPILNNIATHSLFQTTHLYDRNGKLLYDLYDHSIDRGRRTYVNFSDIPDNLVNATIAAEDHSFWTNQGIDSQGILRALIANLHGVREGGSTITQELIKNQFFADTLNNRTPQLKMQEAVLAIGLTQQYPKWKIMEMYLNTVFYGHSNFGVEATAQDYFGLKPTCSKGVCKPAVAQLDLAQASLIAGLPQSPTLYMPLVNKDYALKRQSDILDNMLKLNMITQAQKTQAELEMKNYKFKITPSVEHAPHFVEYVIDKVLIPLFGADNLLNGGYSIYTTLDLDLENQVEAITKKWIYGSQADAYGYSDLKTIHNLNNAAVVVTDPKTGEILAMNGSVDYNSSDPHVQGNFNSAVDAIRQPGSSIKPIVYAAAFEKGWYPAMVVPDIKTYFPNGAEPYSPPNYDGNYHGATMTVRRAIANSYNIPAVEAFEYAGIPDILNLAGRLGLTNMANTPKDKQGPSMALGTAGESLLNMTGAYATFANGGVRMPQTSVLKIVDNQERTIYDLAKAGQRGQRVMSSEVAYLMTSILSDTEARHEEFAPGNPLELDRPAAAKTGTTDDFVDNWTMGYTPHLAVGVWAGNSNNDPMIQVIGITGAGPIWHDVITWADDHYHFPADDFARPSDVVQATVSANTGLAPAPGEATRTDWVIQGTEPTIIGSNYYVPPTTKPKNGNNGNNGNNGTGGEKTGGGGHGKH
jgi:membrane peptidoglycan carboxypeptidase